MDELFRVLEVGMTVVLCERHGWIPGLHRGVLVDYCPFCAELEGPLADTVYELVELGDVEFVVKAILFGELFAEELIRRAEEGEEEGG